MRVVDDRRVGARLGYHKVKDMNFELDKVYHHFFDHWDHFGHTASGVEVVLTTRVSLLAVHGTFA